MPPLDDSLRIQFAWTAGVASRACSKNGKGTMAERAFSERSGGRVRRGSPRDWTRGQAAPNTAEIQAFVEKISRLMDTAFEVPGLGWRFGFDALVGLIPGIGDLATTLVSLYLLLLASRT